MSDFLFVFFSGIAIATGINYLWIGYVKAEGRTDVLFGLFSLVSGLYYLASSTGLVPLSLTLLLAVGMFILFPWYFSHEAKYVKKNLLWIITACGIGYYITAVWAFPTSDYIVPYFFSYTAYVLIAIYGIVSIKRILERNDLPGWPFVLVMGYFIFFVTEEMAYDIFGAKLPWRQVFSITYLDLFPVFIVGLKLTLLIYDQFRKFKLEESLALYKSNIDLIFNQSKKFVLSLDQNGVILFTNPHFIEFFGERESLLQTDFLRFLTITNKEEFLKTLFNNKSNTGTTINLVHTLKGDLTIAWSFVKLKGPRPGLPKEYVTLFGLDISQQVENEKKLQVAFNQLEELKNKLQAENIQLKHYNKTAETGGKLVGQSPNFKYVINRIEDVAPIQVPVLLEGETGVGKELFANQIHERSHRREKDLVKVNCAAIPEELIESELFGFRKGAFTGASHSKRGFFEIAHKGSIFLDEIGELPISLQPKLLRVLQEGEIQPLGAEKPIKIDVRIIAATNRSLEKEVEEGRFRSDLYYRINVFPITIPPLRKRKTDIPLLINSFIDTFNQKYSKNIQQISESLMEDLVNYSWPGNIRQLRNVIERSLITSSESTLKLAEPLPIEKEYKLGGESLTSDSAKTIGSLAEFERHHIQLVLRHCEGKISGKGGAAEVLKLPPSTLRSKMKKLGL